jgi:site-specific DNA-adenine methylase
MLMSKATKEVLNRIPTWPEEDQQELAEVAREIESRRTGVYVLSDEEKAAIEESRRSGVASDEQVDAFWKRHRVV